MNICVRKLPSTPHHQNKSQATRHPIRELTQTCTTLSTQGNHHPHQGGNSLKHLHHTIHTNHMLPITSSRELPQTSAPHHPHKPYPTHYPQQGTHSNTYTTLSTQAINYPPPQQGTHSNTCITRSTQATSYLPPPAGNSLKHLTILSTQAISYPPLSSRELTQTPAPHYQHKSHATNHPHQGTHSNTCTTLSTQAITYPPAAGNSLKHLHHTNYTSNMLPTTPSGNSL